MIRIIEAFIVLALLFESVAAFVVVPPSTSLSSPFHADSTVRFSSSSSTDNDSWISLSGDDRGVLKRTVEEGTVKEAETGDTVAIFYTGKLGEINWDVEGVISCWLLEQQGLEGLADGFRDANVDATTLMDDALFTEDFVANTLGVSNKIQIKKLVMASKRLAATVEEYPAGTLFDYNVDDPEPFTFELGKKKVIRAMELAVSTMKEGERAEIVCRSDYAYGKEGIRTSFGDVMVPEYATLCFNIKLVKCT